MNISQFQWSLNLILVLRVDKSTARHIPIVFIIQVTCMKFMLQLYTWLFTEQYRFMDLFHLSFSYNFQMRIELYKQKEVNIQGDQLLLDCCICLPFYVYIIISISFCLHIETREFSFTDRFLFNPVSVLDKLYSMQKYLGHFKCLILQSYCLQC